MSEYQRLEELEVWKNCRYFRNELFLMVQQFSNDEKYRLRDQILRASRSITNNIAEGYGRYNYQENIQYLRISRGSVYECIDHLYCCYDEKRISKKEFDDLYDLGNRCLRLINGYIKYLQTQKFTVATK